MPMYSTDRGFLIVAGHAIIGIISATSTLECLLALWQHYCVAPAGKGTCSLNLPRWWANLEALANNQIKFRTLKVTFIIGLNRIRDLIH